MIENMLTQDTSYLEEALIENMVEAIRFDIDYHCFWHRIARPEDCQIDYNLYERIQIARDKGHAIYSPSLEGEYLVYYLSKVLLETMNFLI